MSVRDQGPARGDARAGDARARAGLALALGTALVAAPVRALWADASWWAPFAAWAGLVALAALSARALERRQPR